MINGFTQNYENLLIYTYYIRIWGKVNKVRNALNPPCPYSIMKRLKNNINIPQAQVIKHFKGKLFESRKNRMSELDIIDMAIYDFFYGYMQSKSKKIFKIVFESEQYYWAAYSMILRELPLLGIKKDALRDRINKLVNAKLIKKCIKKIEVKTNIFIDGCFFTLGEMSDFMHYTYYNKQEGVDTGQGGDLTQVKTKAEGIKFLSPDTGQGNLMVCKGSDILQPITNIDILTGKGEPDDPPF